MAYDFRGLRRYSPPRLRQPAPCWPLSASACLILLINDRQFSAGGNALEPRTFQEIEID